ncbi:SafA/ExsA family spore coat assembly protein [Halobacillus salinus]|uniref:SafA/ExsA family spore coat assembly protein n=1 Tax=Halobacillus salinus TaxID=192814 RepID=A0A4Z0H2T8_9BACI|nr:SafA/ExsA family spore coat assembly protein [Halobacillus salinus]TGB04184.1 SafA/ExsA family spore coat assembly protein [Halobacillus salinus]
MRIHIVQKGDTLWNIAKKYGVSFEEVKAMNTQLSNPDMIMPGMKIKVPQGTKPVKKEGQVAPAKKEMPKAQTPYKDTSPKPIPVIKEDEKEAPVKGVMQKPMMPMQPQPINMNMQMPSIDQQMQNYYTTFHLPQMPMAQPQPMPEEESSESVEKPAVKGVEAMPMQQPCMQPQLINSDFYCCPPHPMHPMQMPMHQMPMQQMPMQPMPGYGPMVAGQEYEESSDMMPGSQAGGDCGCGGGQPQYGPMMPQGGQMMPYGQQPQMQQPFMQNYGQNPYGQMPQGGGWNPYGQGQWGPYGGGGMPQQPWNPAGQWSPWRDDDVNEE